MQNVTGTRSSKGRAYFIFFWIPMYPTKTKVSLLYIVFSRPLSDPVNHLLPHFLCVILFYHLTQLLLVGRQEDIFLMAYSD